MVLFTKEQIQAMVERVADEIVRDYGEQELVLVVLLKGAMFFGADLTRAIERRRQERRLYNDCMRVSSYGDSQTSSGEVKLEMDIQRSVAGKHVLVVDDVADSRYTLRWVYGHLRNKGPASLKTCVALNKSSRCLLPDVKLDYVGFSEVEGFLVGYGLDDKGTCRGLEEIIRKD